jgi:dolichol-phosphate mannosyltransferase|tara:strand:+ start:2372 stop:3103 length:732 start_codon:yes stop_codon:yes gene_type:complete
MILLPVLNEEDGLERVLHTIPHMQLKESGWSSSVVIIDGNSSDNSRKIGKESGCEVLVQPTKGKGEAIRVGFEYAIKNQFDAVVMFDADQTYHPEDMLKMLPQLESGQIIVGNRLTNQMHPHAMTTQNWIGNHLLTWSAVMLFGLEIHDVCSGYWIFDKEAIKKMNLNSMDFEIEAEMYAECAVANIQLRNYPIRYQPRIGQPKLGSIRDGSSILKKLIIRRLFPHPVDAELGRGKLSLQPNQ